MQLYFYDEPWKVVKPRMPSVKAITGGDQLHKPEPKTKAHKINE